MIFAEASFFVLFGLTALVFFGVPSRWRYGVLVLSGFLFYGLYAPAFLWLVSGLILLTFLASGRVGIWLNVAVLMGFMVYFKMKGGHSISPSLLTAEGETAIAFPLGLSFLTFELIHFSVERHRGNIPSSSLWHVAAFGFYFPCRIAGPIKRYQPFNESVRTSHWSMENFYQGSVRILWGFLKKVVLADILALIVPLLNDVALPRHLLWGGLIAYSLYIFLDFSAYTDIAIGMSRVLGLSVPENFHWPYLSRNIRDFWSRWHMSLSSWLGDYLFLPMAKRLTSSWPHLSPKAAAGAAYGITFTLCGLWHGPSSHFLLWGFTHGILLAGYALYRASGISFRLGPVASVRGRRATALSTLVSTGITFLLVTLGWVFFSTETPKALELYRRLLGGSS